MNRSAKPSDFLWNMPVLQRGDVLRDPSGRLFRVIDKTTVTPSGPFAFELVETGGEDARRVFDMTIVNCQSGGATDGQVAAGADLTSQEPAAAEKADGNAEAGCVSSADSGADGCGFPPTHFIRPVLSVDDACDRLPASLAVVARCVAMHDGLAAGDDLLLHLLEQQARRIGQGALFREAIKLSRAEA